MARVLIVDDEESIRTIIGAFAAKDGHTVALAGDAIEALDILSKEPFDVVVTDIILPRKSGVVLLADIREAQPDVQVIMMTGEPEVGTAAEAVRQGAFDYLAKPVSKDAITKVVAAAAAKKALLDENRSLEEENRKHREHLEELVDAKTEQIREALEGTVHIVSDTVEIRDPYTAGHQRRVTVLACAVGTELDIPEEGIDGLRVAGLLHDIGKMSIPAEILTKPTRLTEIEYALIQGHPQVAYDLLKSIRFPWPVAQIVLQHHERLDGSGYPRGLKGEEMLPEATILAVCDVVEAMAAHRPYRAALGVDAALEEIEKNKGRLYSEDVVDACVQLFAKGGFSFEEQL